MDRFKQFLGRISAVSLLAMFGLTQSVQAQCPNTDLTANQTGGCIPAPITYSLSNLPNNAEEVTWYFNSTDSLQSSDTDDRSFTYQDSGAYNPSAKLYDANGNLICEVSLDAGTVNIYENPDADFAVQGTSQCFQGNSYQFNDQSNEGSGPINNYQWTFGDGNSSNQENPTHSYSQAISGPNIVLQITDVNGCTDLAQRQVSNIEVFSPVEPRFAVDGDYPDCPETEITLNNNTGADPNRIREITYDFDDPNNTTETYTRGPNGWGSNYSSVDFTYTESGTYNPSLTVEDDNGCTETFTFQSGVTNVIFSFDKSIVTNSPICLPSTSVPFSHTPDASSTQAFTFGSIGMNGFAPHQPPPNPIELGLWSGAHGYPSPGVKSIRLDVANVCGALDTLYRKQAVIEGPATAITLPNPPFPLATSRGAKDQPITLEQFRNADRRGCLRIDTIRYVRRNSNGGFTNPPSIWEPNNQPAGSPDFPYQMVFYNKTSDVFSDLPEGDLLLDPLSLADTIDKGSVTVEFLNRNLNYDITDGDISVDIRNNNAYLRFNKEPNNPPYRFRVNYRAGDSTVYRPPSGASDPQNMHDTDVYKPNCQAPNLVRFTNNSTKNRAFRDKNGNVEKREFFYIDTAVGDSLYRTFTNPSGQQDTLYFHFYEGYDVPDVTDNGYTFQVNDSSQQQYLNRRIPFDHNLPYLDLLDEGQGAHGLPLSAYLNRLQNEGYLSGGINLDSVGKTPGGGYDRAFDLTESYQGPVAGSFYAQDFKDTFVEDKNDDLSPWGSDSLQYTWNFSDPNGEACTTRTAWASKQPDYLYNQFTDTVTVSGLTNGEAQIPLNLPTDFSDTLANNRTRINVFSNNQIGLGDLNTYGQGYDIELINGTWTLRIWDSRISSGDQVGIKFTAGNGQFNGRRCNFSTAPAPYHYYDSSGCWQARLQAEDTVTGCAPNTAVQRIFMGPPRADWSQEAVLERRSKVLTTGYSVGNNTLLMDSLKLHSDLYDKAVEVLTGKSVVSNVLTSVPKPVEVTIDNSFVLDESEYTIEQDSVARLVLNNPSRIPLGAQIEATFTVREYAIIEGDTVDLENMRYDLQQKLPTWQDGDPDSVIRRGMQLLGLGCENAPQSIDISEALPNGQCGGAQSWALVIDTASTFQRRPGFDGPYAWQLPTKFRCTDTIDIDGDGQLDTVERARRQFQWVTNQTWDMRIPPREFAYDTSGCMDVGFWVRSGNCVDTHYYRNYKYISNNEPNFNVLNPDTFTPSPNRQFGPLPLALSGQVPVYQNSSYRIRRVGEDTTSIQIAMERDQERIRNISVDYQPTFLTYKPQTPPDSNVNIRSVEYDNPSGDTVYVLCDSIVVNNITTPSGGTVRDTTCVDRTLYPERVCGPSAINDQPLSELRKTKEILDSFTLVDAGGVYRDDSIDHTEIGASGNPVVVDMLPPKSKLWRFSIGVKEPFQVNDTVRLVAIDNPRTLNVSDTVLTFTNLTTEQKANQGFGVDYLGVIEDSSDLIKSVSDTTLLALVKNGATSQGALALELRYKPYIPDVQVDKPGIYALATSLQPAKEGCGSNTNNRYLEIGHYARFDPEIPGRQNNSVVCSNSDNDTVFFYNKAQRIRQFANVGSFFPRYYDFFVDQNGNRFYGDATNYWQDPKGIRNGSISDGHQYERVRYDLNSDGYYETKYDIDTLLYVQDLDRDSTFEKVLDSYDVNGDGIKEVVPYYVYDSGGIYDISMKTTDSTGRTQIMEREDLVRVTNLQAFIDTVGSDLACAPVTVDFIDDSELSYQYKYETDSDGNRIDSTKIDSVTNWSWEFNDGKDTVNNYSTPSVKKVFTQNDTFDIELRVESEAGCIDSSQLMRSGGSRTVIRDGDTLTTSADSAKIPVIGPDPDVELQSALSCEPGKFILKNGSEQVTELNIKKGNGEERTIGGVQFLDSFIQLEYREPGVYNFEISGFAQVPNTSTANPNDSFRCDAPVQDTTLPDYDSNRFKVRVKGTNEVDFAIQNQDLCPEENLGSNLRTTVNLKEDADPAYDSFYWAMGQGDTLLRSSANADIRQEERSRFYANNEYDTFDVTLIPIGADTLCYDTATKQLRTTAVTAKVDTTPQPEGVSEPRSNYTFTNSSEFGEQYKWYFFGAEPTVQEATLGDNLGESGVYYLNAPGEGSVFETDSTGSQRVDYYTDRGYYWVGLRAINPEGCSNTDTIRIDNVKDTAYDRSNVFTPNSDNTNDRFTFRVQGDESFKMTIYNRWGNVVYETTSGSSNNNCFWTNERSDFDGECNESGKDPSNPRGCKYCQFWDGTTQSGGDAPQGTYFYKITYNYEETEDGRGGQGDTQTGTVTLLR